MSGDAKAGWLMASEKGLRPLAAAAAACLMLLASGCSDGWEVSRMPVPSVSPTITDDPTWQLDVYPEGWSLTQLLKVEEVLARSVASKGRVNRRLQLKACSRLDAAASHVAGWDWRGLPDIELTSAEPATRRAPGLRTIDPDPEIVPSGGEVVERRDRFSNTYTGAESRTFWSSRPISFQDDTILGQTFAQHSDVTVFCGGPFQTDYYQVTSHWGMILNPVTKKFDTVSGFAIDVLGAEVYQPPVVGNLLNVNHVKADGHHACPGMDFVSLNAVDYAPGSTNSTLAYPVTNGECG